VPGGLEGGIAWINTGGPIHLEDLRGKVVLLDFWTYCCINCHHVLPDLAALEQKYKNELVVIGVHTAKFDAERETENIRKKVAEYRIKHPVVNDANQVLWTRFGVSSWPTLVLVDATGKYVGAVSGEGHAALLDRAIAGWSSSTAPAASSTTAPWPSSPRTRSRTTRPCSTRARSRPTRRATGCSSPTPATTGSWSPTSGARPWRSSAAAGRG
jgi:thiol-disulfide isomerase/thioredoxin